MHNNRVGPTDTCPQLRRYRRGLAVPHPGLGQPLFMNTQAFSIVCSTRTQVEADLIISVLRDAGLHPLELDTFGHFSLAGADVDYSVRVPTPELADARELLREFDADVASPSSPASAG